MCADSETADARMDGPEGAGEGTPLHINQSQHWTATGSDTDIGVRLIDLTGPRSGATGTTLSGRALHIATPCLEPLRQAGELLNARCPRAPWWLNDSTVRVG